MRVISVLLMNLRNSGWVKTGKLVMAAAQSELSSKSDSRFKVSLRVVPHTQPVEFSFRGRSSDLATILISTVEQNLTIPSSYHDQLAQNAFAGITAMTRRAVIVDLGSNIGSSAAFLATRYPGSKILGFEPDAANHELAVLNTSAFGPGVEILPCAVGSTDGVASLERILGSARRDDFDGYRLPLHETPAAGAYSIEADVETTPVVSPGSIVDRFGASDIPFFLKVDIESGERAFFDAVNAAPEWWYRFPIVVIELHDYVFENFAASRSFLQYHWSAPRERVLLQNQSELFSLDVQALRDFASTVAP